MKKAGRGIGEEEEVESKRGNRVEYGEREPKEQETGKERMET